MPSSSPEADWILRFIRPLNRSKIRYLVSGSVASILYGEPRLTNDIDVIVFLSTADLKKLEDEFPEDEFYLPPRDVISLETRREQRGHFNIIHSASGMKMDCYTAGRDEMHTWAFRAAREIHYQGEKLVLAPPEYVIVRKLEFYREGGSEKHLRDIRAMLSVSDELIDRGSLNEWIQKRGVIEQWRKVELEL